MDLNARCLASAFVAITLLTGCAHSFLNPDEIRDTSGAREPNGGFQATFSGDPVLLAMILDRLKPIVETQKSHGPMCSQTTSWGLKGDPTASAYTHGVAVLTFNCTEFRQKPQDGSFWAELFGRLYAEIAVFGDSSYKQAALGDQIFVHNGGSAVSLHLSNRSNCKQWECPTGRPGWYEPNNPLCRKCPPQ